MHWVLRMMRFWPPYWGAGIFVVGASPDLRSVVVEMKSRPWNRNYVGTHFGGSLYSMVDPFYMLMLLHNLGNRFIVWDQSAEIRFLKPARGRVRARFELTEEQVSGLANSIPNSGDRVRPEFEVDIKDEQGELVATVKKVLYVRRK